MENIEEIIQKINSVLAKINETNTDKKQLKGDDSHIINEEIKKLTKELKDIQDSLLMERENILHDLMEIENSKGKKDCITCIINGKKEKKMIPANNRIKNKYRTLIKKLNLIDENIVLIKNNIPKYKPRFTIDWDLVNSLPLEKQLAYFNAKTKEIIKAKSGNLIRIFFGDKYCEISACDKEIFKECFNNYKRVYMELELQKNNSDSIKLKALHAAMNKNVEVEYIETPSYTIDWDFVNNLATLEDKRDYFNNLAIKIVKIAKNANRNELVKVPLGNDSCKVYKKDEMVFNKCFEECKKIHKALKNLEPTCSIDWDLVNSFNTSLEKANYFESIAEKISEAAKNAPKDAIKSKPYRDNNYIFMKKDEEIFETCLEQFENYYTQYLMDKKKEEELQRIKAQEEKIAIERANSDNSEYLFLHNTDEIDPDDYEEEEEEIYFTSFQNLISNQSRISPTPSENLLDSLENDQDSPSVIYDDNFQYLNSDIEIDKNDFVEEENYSLENEEQLKVVAAKSGESMLYTIQKAIYLKLLNRLAKKTLKNVPYDTYEEIVDNNHFIIDVKYRSIASIIAIRYEALEQSIKNKQYTKELSRFAD